MNFDRTQQELLSYVKSNAIWKLFVPVAELLLLACELVLIVGNFVSFGALSGIVGILTYIAIVICLAKGNYKVLTIGLMLRSIDYAIIFLQHIFSYSSFQLSSLLYCLIWFIFAVQAFKKSGMTVNELKETVTSKEGIKKSFNLDEAKTFDINEAKESINIAKNEAMDTINKVKSEIQENNK